MQEVGRELGVRYVLEGSVRKAGNRVRITAQLVDAASGGHLWAERYDRDLTDIFAIQDEITSQVVAAIEPALSRAESKRGAAKQPEHMGAWDYCQRGFWHLNKLTGTDGSGSLWLVQNGHGWLDPELAEAHLGLARALDRAQLGLRLSRRTSHRWCVRQRQSALRAAALDSENRYAQYVLAQTSHWAGDAQAAIAYANRAVELNGNFALGHFYLGVALNLDGRHQGSARSARDGLAPQAPAIPRMSTWLANKARALYHLQRYAEAIEAAAAARRIQPHAYGSLVLVASCAQLGRNEEAAEVSAELPACPVASQDREPVSGPLLRPGRRVRIWPRSAQGRAFSAVTAKASASKDEATGDGRSGRTALCSTV